MVTAGEYFARALAAKDSAALCALLADPVDFQALTPGRHWQATTGRQVAEEIIFEHWFGAGAHILELCSVSEPDLVMLPARRVVRTDRGALGQPSHGVGVDIVGRQQRELGKRGAQQRRGHQRPAQFRENGRRVAQFAAGPESLEVRLFAWDEIPWSELAFPSVRWALDQYREAAQSGDFRARRNPG